MTKGWKMSLGINNNKKKKSEDHLWICQRHAESFELSGSCCENGKRRVVEIDFQNPKGEKVL